MMSKKSPQLRFEGFTDDWEVRKLSSISERVTRKNKNNESTLPLTISAQDGLIDQNDFFNKQVASRDVTGYFLVKNGEFAYNKSYSNGYPWGAIKRLDKYDMGVLSTLYIVFRPTEINSQFLVSYYDTTRWYREVSKNAAEGARNHGLLNIAPTDFFNTLLVVPKIVDEQEKIGSFFKQMDNTIALHQRKLDLLKEQKKGYLQKMFPKNGEKVPELRFAGFADDWEERKLSGIIEKLSGGASIKPTDYLEDGIRTIPKGAVNATGIADLSGSKYISEDFFEKNITSHAHTSNLVTSLRDLVPSAPNMGRIVRIEGDDEQFLMPQGVYKLELFEGMDEDFLISFSNSDKYRKIISAEKNGSTQVHIRNGEFLNIDINLPSEHEQKKIGSFFKQLDNTIALHQRKLDLLKEQKKGFLQKMFV
ncbi:restriction endonuclease subunit S (plasmid) [Lactococcus cremoris]|uniref:Restriction endonuclease subunit S n=1 Tax=Lactococcus lactis subsp. cremoris TaxID=1359 RepID=A0AAD1NK63_LACLC|nr:restriction endonuclease subunit S [Lactococcus cremoris]BCO04729.1 restriction endonuclease subunit S [Lactococcus cremoris]BCO07572.1 restriction endonuclease subunit S [Lactococcus cremoris]